MAIDLEPIWLSVLKETFESDYMKSLKQFLLAEKSAGMLIYPPSSQIFAAFNQTPFDKVRVVILGQDPYHGRGQAHGLSFSVPAGQNIPPSLQNIYKEIKSDLNIETAQHGDLTRWAKQGVLLLNAVLTVRANQAVSHQGKGWEQFTDTIIKALSEQKEHLVFLLWGNYAKQKASLIDTSKHLILTAPHPSPFSAHSGFFGSKHFSQANAYLQKWHHTSIDWF